MQDIEIIKPIHDKKKTEAARNAKVKEKQLEADTMKRLLEWCEAGNDVRFGQWCVRSCIVANPCFVPLPLAQPGIEAGL